LFDRLYFQEFMRIVLLIVVALVSFACRSNEAALLEARDRCATQARTEFSMLKNPPALSDYTNHFNVKRHTCVAQIKMTYTTGETLYDGSIDSDTKLIDVFEHKIVGQLNTSVSKPGEVKLNICNMVFADGAGSQCSSVQEFEEFAKTLMTE